MKNVCWLGLIDHICRFWPFGVDTLFCWNVSSSISASGEQLWTGVPQGSVLGLLLFSHLLPLANIFAGVTAVYHCVYSIFSVVYYLCHLLFEFCFLFYSYWLNSISLCIFCIKLCTTQWWTHIHFFSFRFEFNSFGGNQTWSHQT